MSSRMANVADVRVSVAGGEGDEAAEQQQRTVRIAEARLAEQVRRAKSEPAGRVDRTRQVPGSVQQVVPTEQRAHGFAGRGDREETHAQSPDELEASPSLEPLIEQGDREDQRQQGGQRGEQDSDVHRIRFRSGGNELVGLAVLAVA